MEIKDQKHRLQSKIIAYVFCIIMPSFDFTSPIHERKPRIINIKAKKKTEILQNDLSKNHKEIDQLRN